MRLSVAIIRLNSQRPLRREATRLRRRRAIPSPGMSSAVPSEASASSATANKAKSRDQARIPRMRARLKPSHHFASLNPSSHDQRKPYSARRALTVLDPPEVAVSRVGDKAQAVEFNPTATAADLDAALDPDDEADAERLEQVKEVIISEAAVGRQPDPARREVAADQLAGAFDHR